MRRKMSVNDLVLVQGMRDTRLTLSRWSSDPWSAVGPWLLLSMAVSVGLLMSVYAVATLSSPDQTRLIVPGYNSPVQLGDYAFLMFRNGLVLTLHALACVAGFIAGSALPLSASQRTGFSKVVHEKAGPFAILFVSCATLFSLTTQAYILGSNASTIAAQIGITPLALIAGILPHALPELTALFLPLAAWLVASRRGRWDELLAATVVTVAIAVPVLCATAAIELWVTPHVLRALAAG